MYVTKDNTPLELEYSEMQDKVFNNLAYQYQFLVLAKGRRAGGTMGAINHIIERSIDTSLNILWVDTIQQNLIPLYNRYFYPVLSNFKPQFYQYRRNSHELDLFNSHFFFRSAERPESLEGFFYDIVVLNEAGLILRGQKGRTLWYNSIYPMTIDRGSTVLFIGTPKGLKPKKNEDADYSLFYELYQKGVDREKGWVSARFDSYCNIEMLAREQLIGHRNRGIELTMEQAREKAIESINQMANDFPFHVRAQEIYGEFIDKQEETIFHEDWFHIVDELPHISRQQQTIISMDTAFKIGESNDFSAAVVIVQGTNGHYYITDIMNEKLEFPQLVNKARQLFAEHDHARYMLVEDKASGISLVQTLRQESQIPVNPVKVDRDKLTRASAITPLFEQGRVHLLKADWNRLYIDQLCSFNGLFDSDDDLVDATSQGLNFLNRHISTKQKPISRKVVRRSDATQGY